MDISTKNLQTRIPIRLPAVKRTAQRTLRYLGRSQGEISIVFVSPQRMKSLNARHLKHFYSTDILTFDYRTPPDKTLAAEIVICPSVARANAVLYGRTFTDEIRLYIVHGILHLTGYDDHSAKDTAVMRKKETEIISFLDRKR